MGADNMDVDPTQTVQAGRTVGESAGSLAGITDAHLREQDRATQTGPGDEDWLWSIIKSIVTAIHEVARGSYTDNTSGLNDHGDGAVLMAGAQRRSDQENNDVVTSI